MKIGLLGYGKMGKTIERLALQQGVDIVWQISRENADELNEKLIRKADVVIEFTRPESAFEHVMLCLRAGRPVVCGTTGWLDKLPEAEDFCRKNQGAMLWASNFSVGVNLFFAVNAYLAELLNKQPEYQLSATEIHHIHKLDAPSGTAISLLKQVIERVDRYSDWALGDQKTGKGIIPIEAIREDEVPGTHIMRWKSPVDQISIEHRADSRDGFALGAIQAAKWIDGKEGVFSMADVLGI